MEDFDKIIDQISNETLRSLTEMKQSKDAIERKAQAEIIHLLCESMGFMVDSAASAMSGLSAHDFIDDYEDD